MNKSRPPDPKTKEEVTEPSGADTVHPALGEVVAGYRLVGLLGEGGRDQGDGF